jgi:hypothetical protein
MFWSLTSPHIKTGAATNQWPITTAQIDSARRKSTYLLRDSGVFAAIAAALGDSGGAVQLLQQAIQEGIRLGYYHHRDPEWETLRDYRPFQVLMRPKG